jgi:hypothetical protein
MSARRARLIIDASERTRRPPPCGQVVSTIALGLALAACALPLALCVALTREEPPR